MSAGENCVLFHCARYNQITPIVTMGLWGLADHLTTHGFPTKIVHTGVEEELHPSFDVSRYVDERSMLVGASAHWFPMVAESLDVLRMAKQREPRCFTVLGGYSASYFWRELLDGYPWIDGVIRGDGEAPLLELAKKLQDGASNLTDVPNLAWRFQGSVTENELTYVSTPEDLEPIEFANYRKYFENYEHGKEYYFKKSSLIADYTPTELPLASTFYLLTGKGCPVNCSICGGGRDAQRILNGRSGCMFLSPDKIVRTVKQAMRHGYRNMYVCFDPAPSKPRYFDYLKAIRDAGLDVDLSFGFWRLPTLEAIREFKKTSRNLLFDISPESISERVRRSTKDSFFYTNQELYDAIDLAFRERVYLHVYFCYFLPTETIEDLRATRLAVWELNAKYPHYIEAIYIKISTDPGSPLYREPAKHRVHLSVANLQEHLAQGRLVTDANILVHELDTVSKEDHAWFRCTVEMDGGIKRMFKYLTKYLVRAFPSAEDFVAFLDAFYLESGLRRAVAERETRSGAEVLLQMAAFARTHPTAQAIKPYAHDLIEYVRALTSAHGAQREEPVRALPVGDALRQGRLTLVAQATIVALHHDIFAAVNELIDRKAFGVISDRPNWMLLLAIEGKVATFNLSESLFELLERIASNRSKTVAELLTEVAHQYTDEPAQVESVESDLIIAMQQIAPVGIFRLIPPEE